MRDSLWFGATSVQSEREDVALAVRACVQPHRPTCAPEPSGAPGDGQRAVLGVVERALHDDLAALEERRPRALIGLPDDHADAVALIRADLPGVAAVEDRVGEREDVPRAVAGLASVGR